MNDLAIHRTPSAHDAPLVIGQILARGVAQAPAQEIVHGSLRYSYATLSERVARLAGALASARRQARLDGGRDGLGQPSLPRVLLRRADDGGRAAHGERPHLAGAGALHDQPRAGRRHPRQRRVPAAARGDLRPDASGREAGAAQRPAGRPRHPPPRRRRVRGNAGRRRPDVRVPGARRGHARNHVLYHRHHGPAEGRLLQPSPARAPHLRHVAGARQRAARHVHGRATSTCR